MTRQLHIPVTEGLPDAGAPGQWLGRDEHGAVYTLRWIPQEKCWGALGWSVTDRRQPWPHLVMLREECEAFIVGHVEGPAIDSAARESFLAAALRDCAESDREIAIRLDPEGKAPSRTLQHWLWTLLLLLGLPAAALAIAFLLAHAPKRDCNPAPGAGVAGLFLCRSEP